MLLAQSAPRIIDEIESEPKSRGKDKDPPPHSILLSKDGVSQ
jgi:hypothetical protein